MHERIECERASEKDHGLATAGAGAPLWDSGPCTWLAQAQGREVALSPRRSELTVWLCRVHAFLTALGDPEVYGFAVGREVREEAKKLLGTMP